MEYNVYMLEKLKTEPESLNYLEAKVKKIKRLYVKKVSAQAIRINSIGECVI